MKQNRSLPFRSALLFLLTFSVLSCTDDVDDATQKLQTAKALSDSLLTVTDMPQGWEETQRQVFEKRENENPSIDPSIWCAAAQKTAEPLVVLAGDSGADVEMSRSQGGGKGATMMRLQAWSNKDVEEYYATAALAAEKCDGVTSTDDAGVTTRIKLITGKSIGDESVSWSEQVDPPTGLSSDKFSSLGRTTVARFGSVIMVLQIGDAGPSSSVALMDETTWWNIVSQAGDKLAKITS